MGTEGATPERRTTRSSSSLSKPSLDAPKTPLSPPQSLPFDLLFSDEPLSIDTLLSNLPGRSAQILEISRLIGPPNSPMLPLLLYGGVSTGKTSAILQIFHHLNRPFVYTSCRSCHSPRILFESVLNQLLLHRRHPGNGYSSARRCERASDFVNLLRDALSQVTGSLRGKKSKLDGNREMIYLIFDNVERIRSWNKSSDILALLFRLFDVLNFPEVGLIYISNAAPDAYYSMTGSVEPVSVHFPDYTVDDLFNILMLRSRANPKLYSSFLSVVLKPFFRVTRRIDELATAFDPLFQKYCEPLADLNLVPDESMKRRLFVRLQPHLAASLNETFRFPSECSFEAIKEGTCSKKGNIRKLNGRETSNELDFHMSVSAKYLLISAFLASRNPATLDAAFFDSTGGSNNHKRRRKSSQAIMDQKDETAEEMHMKGPGSFPLERLLAIFQCITSVGEGTLEEEQLEDGMMTESGNVGLMSDVLLQLSTLCNANFICKSGSCPLEGSTRYRSTVDEDVALKVARSINFPLSKYLYRR
ncbi:origin of replication complex subunit 5 [Phoenix dactylifera]|uniref:Origin of replication complex subunit 5 n=1 Tax=Phoenix dactylifera TaxID=42345 RepID=A0A8B7CWD5_PHODC|nr:origin of replication complex subunit 5 [Phoenix dactylifera]